MQSLYSSGYQKYQSYKISLLKFLQTIQQIGYLCVSRMTKCQSLHLIYRMLHIHPILPPTHQFHKIYIRFLIIRVYLYCFTVTVQSFFNPAQHTVFSTKSNISFFVFGIQFHNFFWNFKSLFNLFLIQKSICKTMMSLH